MDAIKRKAIKARKAREIANSRYMQELYARWGRFSTIAVWEIAALMQGNDPDNLQDVVINDQGDGVNLSDETRMLLSAITIRDLVAYPSSIEAPKDETEVEVKTLIPWLHIQGYDVLADGLAAALNYPTPSTSVVPIVATTAVQSEPNLPDPERRLKALRDLGGNGKWMGRKGMMKWRFTKIKELTAEETRLHKKRCTEKTIRKDLCEALDAERMSKASGSNP